MQIKFQADLVRGSATVVAASGADLSGIAADANLFFTLGKSGINYDVGAITAPATGGDGRWRVQLAAPYAGATVAGAGCVLHLSFTAGGIPYPTPGDTEWPAIARRQAQALDSRVPLVGWGAGTTAAGDDPRLVAAAREVASVAALRAAPVPTADVDSGVLHTTGYHQPGDGGDNVFRWDAASTLTDDGGSVIACTANGSHAGRFIALNHGSGETNVRQWGAHPTLATSTQNCAAFQAANDHLPPLYGPDASEKPEYLTATGRQGRAGIVRVPAGSYHLSDRFLPYNAVTVQGEGWRSTAIILDAGVYTDPTSPTYFVEFENSVGVAFNNHFGACWTGIAINCGGNAGSAGLKMYGAQGTVLDHTVVGGFGTVGVSFTGKHIGSLWVEGGGTALGPGLILGDNGTTSDNLSIEHFNDQRRPAAYWNKTVPPYLYIAGPANLIGCLQFEGDDTVGPVTFAQLSAGVAQQTVIDILSINVSNTANTAKTRAVEYLSNATPGLTINQIHNRLGVPISVYDLATNRAWKGSSFKDTLQVEHLSAEAASLASPRFRDSQNAGAVWQSDDNAADRKKIQAYVDAAGDLIIASLNDAENASANLAVFKRDGTVVIKPPPSDPHIAGALWNNGGVPSISGG